MEASEALPVADRILKKILDRREFVLKTDDYYEGKQSLTFASPEWAKYHSERYKGFSDNWCAAVADASAERHRVLGLRGEELQDLWQVWERNDGDSKAAQGFLSADVNAVSYALVWPDSDGYPRLTWEHASQVYIERDVVSGEKIYMVKTWSDESQDYLALYTKTGVWKWVRESAAKSTSGIVVRSTMRTDAGGWKPYKAEADEAWPLPNPYGEVPGAEIANRLLVGRDPISSIKGAMVMQDAINLLWAYLFGAADHASLPARVVMGQEPPKIPIFNEAGDVIGEEPVDIESLRKGRMLWLTGENTKIAQWDSAKLDVFTAVIEVAVGHIAAQTRTPPHYLNTKAGLSNLSGDGLENAETGLVKKVERQRASYASGIRDIFRMFALILGRKDLADAVSTNSLVWAPAARKSESQQADALIKKKQIGYPLEYLLELDGVPPEDIPRIMQMIDRELGLLEASDGIANVASGGVEVLADAEA